MPNTPANIDGNISAASVAALIRITAEGDARPASRSQMIPAMEQTMQAMFGVNAGPTSKIFAERLAALGSAAQEPVGMKADPVSKRPVMKTGPRAGLHLKK